MSFFPNIPNYLISATSDFATSLPLNSPGKELSLSVTPEAITRSLPRTSIQSILSPSTQSADPTTTSVNALGVRALGTQTESLGPFSEGWGNSESPGLANTSFSATPINETKIDLFYRNKHHGYRSNIAAFFATDFFQSLLKNKYFPLRKNGQGVLFLEWDDKTIFQNYIDSRVDIHKDTILVDFIRSMNNEWLYKNTNRELKHESQRAFIEIYRRGIQQACSSVDNDLLREAFFIFKTFEFIWLTYNFHSAPSGCKKEHFFGPFHKDKIEMNSKVFSGMIFEWDSEQKRFQTAEYSVDFMGPFLVNITRKSSDIHYFKSVSEIPPDHLILPSLSIFNSGDSFLLSKDSDDFLFSESKIPGILTSLNNKDFIKSIDNYLRLSLNNFSPPTRQAPLQEIQPFFATEPAVPAGNGDKPLTFNGFEENSPRNQFSQGLNIESVTSPAGIADNFSSFNHRTPIEEIRSLSERELELVEFLRTHSTETAARPSAVPAVLSLALSSNLIETETIHETELSPERYLQLVEFLKAEIWDKKKLADILLNAIESGLTERGECSFRTDRSSFQALEKVFSNFSPKDRSSKEIIIECKHFLEIKIKPLYEEKETGIPGRLAELIAPALVMHKLKELSLHAKYPNIEKSVKAELPVFFVFPEGQKIRIYCLQGSFEGFVVKKIQNNALLSYRVLEELVGASCLEKEEQNESTTALISVEAFDKLRAMAKNSLILKPTVMKYRKEVIKQKVLESPDQADQIEGLDQSEDAALPTQYTGEKRKRSFLFTDEPSQKKPKVTFKVETATEHKVKEINLIQNGIQITEPATDNPKKEGISQTLQSLLGEQNVPVELSLDSFLEAVSLECLKKTIDPIQERNELKKTLVHGEKIDFPINKVIEELGSPRAIAPFNPFLKEYQKKAVEEMLRFSDKELSAFLAAEMGLGKTFMMFEWASQLIASGKKGMHLFLMPVSLLPQMKEEAQRAWLETMRTAWQTRKRLEPDEILKAAVLNMLQECPEGSLRRTYLFYSIAPFLHEWTGDKQFMDSFVTENVVPDIIGVVNRHLNNLKKIPEWKISFEKELAAREDEQTARLAQPSSFQVRPYSFQVVRMSWGVRHDNLLTKEFLLKAASILNIHPGRKNSSDVHRNLEEATRMTDLFASSPITFFKSGELADYLERADPSSSRFLITSFECIQNKNKNIETLLSGKSIASIIVDEADRLHNMDSRDTACVNRLLEHSKKNGAFLQLISGTPFQNDFAEIYTLVSLANPLGSFPSSTQKALAFSLDRCIGKITKEKGIPQQEIDETVLKTFVDFSHFADVIRGMIIKISMKDKHVIRDWNNRIPSFEVKAISIDLQEEAKNRIQSIIDRENNFFKKFHQIKQVLIHPKLESLDRKNPQVSQIIARLNNASDDELTQEIQNSPLLTALIYSEGVQECLQKKDRTLIFVQNLVEADIIKAALSKLYRANQPTMDLYEGSLDSEQKSAIIERFKGVQDGIKPYFLILMTECGGVGLNLQEAARCIIASQSFNPSKDDQARARCIRVNNIGHKIIYEIYYNDSSSTHLRLIRQEKRDWVKFLFPSKADTIEKRFEFWKELLTTMCKRKFINNNVSEEHPRYQAFVQRMNLTAFDVEKYASLGGCIESTKTFMQEDVEMVESSSIQQPLEKNGSMIEVDSTTRLNVKDWFTLPMPVQWPEEKVIKTAAYIRRQSNKNVSGVIQDIQHYKLIEVIRAGVSSDANAKKILSFYEEIAAVALSCDLEGWNVQTYRAEDNQFILNEETLRGAPDTVRLYAKERSINGVSKLHLDILLRK